MKVKDVFDGISAKLEAEFDQISANIQHRPSKGRYRELALTAGFLREFLPRNVEVLSPGEIVDSTGATSGEIDVIIADPRTPRFVSANGYNVVPVECVFGVVEVKSRLDQKELKSAVKNLRTAKSLHKAAFDGPIGFPNFTEAFGRTYDHFPTFSYIFAYDSISLATLREKLWAMERNAAMETRIAAVYVLKKGLLAYEKDGGLVPFSEEGATLSAWKTAQVLQCMATQMMNVMQQAWAPMFALQTYYGGTLPMEKLR